MIKRERGSDKRRRVDTGGRKERGEGGRLREGDQSKVMKQREKIENTWRRGENHVTKKERISVIKVKRGTRRSKEGWKETKFRGKPLRMKTNDSNAKVKRRE